MLPEDWEWKAVSLNGASCSSSVSSSGVIYGHSAALLWWRSQSGGVRRPCTVLFYWGGAHMLIIISEFQFRCTSVDKLWALWEHPMRSSCRIQLQPGKKRAFQYVKHRKAAPISCQTCLLHVSPVFTAIIYFFVCIYASCCCSLYLLLRNFLSKKLNIIFIVSSFFSWKMKVNFSSSPFSPSSGFSLLIFNWQKYERNLTQQEANVCWSFCLKHQHRSLT